MKQTRRQFLSTIVAASTVPFVTTRESNSYWAVSKWTFQEGGLWLDAPIPPGIQPAAVKLNNGMIYDYVLGRLGYNPWRTDTWPG